MYCIYELKNKYAQGDKKDDLFKRMGKTGAYYNFRH
jgi:hypothetical protein